MQTVSGQRDSCYRDDAFPQPWARTCHVGTFSLQRQRRERSLARVLLVWVGFSVPFSPFELFVPLFEPPLLRLFLLVLAPPPLFSFSLRLLPSTPALVPPVPLELRGLLLPPVQPAPSEV